MSRVVTVRYLRRRFWIAKLALVLTLAAAAGVGVLALRTQEVRNDYAIGIQHLGNSVYRLEAELDRLDLDSRRGVADRHAARTAFLTLLEGFQSIVAASRDGAASLRSAEGWLGQGDPGRIAASDGGENAAVLPHDHLVKAPMPESLARIWVPGSGSSDAGPSASLEYVLDRLLLLAGRLTNGEGPLSPAELDRVQTIKSSVAALVSPRLEEITALLDEDMHELADRALVSLLALLAIAVGVALLNVFIIFRPLEHAVMAAQARLEVERDRALEAAAAKRNFLSVMSHELRTPMNGVLGFAGLVLASDLRPEQRRQVEIIRSSGKTLLALVNDILDLSRMEAGALELADAPFSLEGVIGEVLDLARAGAAEKDIETAVYVDPDLPTMLRGDPERVRQILTNLVGNAVKFTERGTVAVEARRLEAADGPTVEIAVRDTGPGIAPDQQARIFERFTQAARPGRQASEGTGLGLAICRELAERMGGDIAIESAPGEGATFRVRLRFEQVETAGDGAAGDGAVGDGAAEAALAGMRVLVVDGNALVAGLVCRQIAGWGLRLATASGAEEALRALEAAEAAGDPFGLAVVDRTLGDADPATLARRIREVPRFSGLGLLLVAEPGGRAAGLATEAGFDAVEEPPLMPRALLRTLARLADGRAGREAPPTPEGGLRARVLLVEDNAVGRQLALSLLQGAGCRVEAVADGAAAVEAAARGGHDVVLMDIRMPVLDGVEATRRIRALAGAAGRVPVIALTANASAEDVAEYRAAGMDDVIAKPIDAGRLLGALARALGGGAARSLPAGTGPVSGRAVGIGASGGDEGRMAATR